MTPDYRFPSWKGYSLEGNPTCQVSFLAWASSPPGTRISGEHHRRLTGQRFVDNDGLLDGGLGLRKLYLADRSHPCEGIQPAGEGRFERGWVGGRQPPADLDGLFGGGQRLLRSAPGLRARGRGWSLDQGGASCHRAALAAREAGHRVPAVDRLPGQLAPEPRSATEHEEIHAVQSSTRRIGRLSRSRLARRIPARTALLAGPRADRQGPWRGGPGRGVDVSGGATIALYQGTPDLERQF